jgi:HEAT repeat protein
LRSPDKALFGIGLRTARELAGSEVTAAVATELAAAPPDRQALLLLVLADRADAGALDAVKKYIFSNHKKVRITALSTLGLLGNASQVELLLQAAQKAPTEVPAVREALLRLRGDNVNQALIAAARSGPAISRGECLLVLSARGATEAMPLFLEGLKAKEESIRQAALSALRRVAGMSEFPELLRNLLSAEAESTRAGLQDLLVNLCRRSEKRAEGVRQLLEAWKTANGPGRLGVLEVLCWLGDPEGLAAVQAGLKDPEVDVRKRVLRALNNWPNSTIFPQLLELARSDSEGSLKVLAIRLAVPLVSRDASLTATVKADRFSQLMKLATSLEEKRLILAALKAAPGALSMALAESQLRDPALANEAAVAVADLVQQNLQEMRALLRKAAQANIDSALRQRLEKLVESLEALKP